MNVRPFQVPFPSRLDDFSSNSIESPWERRERIGRQVPLLLAGVFDYSSNLLLLKPLSPVESNEKTVFPVSVLKIRREIAISNLWRKQTFRQVETFPYKV